MQTANEGGKPRLRQGLTALVRGVALGVVLAGCDALGRAMEPVPTQGLPPIVFVDDFETGALTGWRSSIDGDGGWFVYEDGNEGPDRSLGPGVPFDVPDPPRGRFALVTDMRGPGTRILYRDLRLDGRFSLRLTVFHLSRADLSSQDTLDHDVPGSNQQFRIDLVDPSAAIDSIADGDVLLNVFRTRTGDPTRAGPTDVVVDVSGLAGRIVRLRLVEVDNQGVLNAGADDIRFEPIGWEPGDVELLPMDEANERRASETRR